jgi:hypothetical protein
MHAVVPESSVGKNGNLYFHPPKMLIFMVLLLVLMTS